MASIARLCRQKIPSRVSEFIALASITSTFILFIHTTHLQYQIQSGQIDQYTDATGNQIQDLEEMKELRERLAKKQYDLKRFRELDPMSLNNTKHNKKMTLVFNRVPKVGSQTTMALIRSLSYQNGFSFHKDKVKKSETILLTRREQLRLIQLIDVFRPPSAYVKHVNYINFTEFNYTQPIYINMVRDPVERAISWYYYVRAPWYFVERKQAFPDLPFPSSRWLKKDFETCVTSANDAECQYEEGSERQDFAQQTEFFCGHEKHCTGFNTKIALQKAIEHVEKHYAVVGILEELDMTLTVLEHYVPLFFKGAKNVYYDSVQRFSTVNKNIYKPHVSEKIKNIVRKNFTREIDFYEYCKQRLYKQYAALKLD